MLNICCQLLGQCLFGNTSSYPRYRKDTELHWRINELQLKYQCCGDTSYIKWFDITWMHVNFTNYKLFERKITDR